LRPRFCVAGHVGNAQMRAAILLLQQFDCNIALIPFSRDDLGADVGGGFFGTGGLAADKCFQSPKHVRQLRSKPVQEEFGFEDSVHVPPMLTSAQNRGKSAGGDNRQALAPDAARAHSWLRECAGFAYNDSFGGEAEMPQSWGTATETFGCLWT
jgi:hypothetical protein